MNQFKNLCGMLLLLTFVMASCSKDDDGGGDGNPNPNLENYFACKIDGADWVSNGIVQPTVTRLAVSSDVSAKRLDFFGSPDGGQSISIVVNDFLNGDQGQCINDEKFYGWDHSNYANAYSITSTNGTTYVSDAYLNLGGAGLTRLGFVEITKCESGKISGKFEFTVKDLSGATLAEITEGVFSNVEYVFFE